MRLSIRSIAVLILAMLSLAGCGKKPAEPAPLGAALTRPLVTPDARSGRVVVPTALVVERGGIPGVFVVSADHQARFRMVRIGKNLNGRVDILSGLTGGEALVAGDLRDVHDGSPIEKQ
jgi:hypothetical protein